MTPTSASRKLPVAICDNFVSVVPVTPLPKLENNPHSEIRKAVLLTQQSIYYLIAIARTLVFVCYTDLFVLLTNKGIIIHAIEIYRRFGVAKYVLYILCKIVIQTDSHRASRSVCLGNCPHQ